jgi:hypothetical protein
MFSAEWSTEACRLAHRTNRAIIYVEWNSGRDMCVLAIQTSWDESRTRARSQRTF